MGKKCNKELRILVEFVMVFNNKHWCGNLEFRGQQKEDQGLFIEALKSSKAG